jgi:hypothetical protein
MTRTFPPNTIPEVEEIIQAFRDGLLEILASKLYGVYLYGAVVFPETKYTGDIDFHVVLTEPLTADEQEELNDFHQSLAREYPTYGNEMDGYYILLQDAKGIVPPRSQMWNLATDNSWALHREHIRAGKCMVLHGPDPKEMYPPATWPELEDALRDELAYVERHLSEYPAYCILNLCRLIYSFRTRDVVISKTASAEWAEVNYPQWKELIRLAQRSYRGKGTTSEEAFMEHKLPDMFEFSCRRIEEAMIGM